MRFYKHVLDANHKTKIYQAVVMQEKVVAQNKETTGTNEFENLVFQKYLLRRF